MREQNNEARVVLAIDAIQKSDGLSRRAAAKLYNVPETTLRDRMSGATPITNRRPVAQVLTALEKEAVVQYILDLDARGFSPSLEDVRVMADTSSRREVHVVLGNSGPTASSSEERNSAHAVHAPTSSSGPFVRILIF